MEQDVMESNRNQLFNIIIKKFLTYLLLNMEQQFIYLLNPKNNAVLN